MSFDPIALLAVPAALAGGLVLARLAASCLERRPATWSLAVLALGAAGWLLYLTAPLLDSRPLLAAAVGVGLVGLALNTLTDLEARWIHPDIAYHALLIVIGLGLADTIVTALSVPGIEPSALLARQPLLGAAVIWIPSKAMEWSGKLIAAKRGAGIDPDTGEAVEDIGSGDHVVWLLAGATLGPIGVVIAFVVSWLITGLLIALPMVVIDRIRRRPLGSSHLPLVPGIFVATLLVLLGAV